ncbi:hypothetical protein GCM10023116_11080 [Kistimonas scapharcae]|uniref:Ferrous iron transport protein A n=1 Tax=Kistimonas scapharcae TaxID=1036133 RepID=A0ABP8V0G1_9GAMM
MPSMPWQISEGDAFRIKLKLVGSSAMALIDRVEKARPLAAVIRPLTIRVRRGALTSHVYARNLIDGARKVAIVRTR